MWTTVVLTLVGIAVGAGGMYFYQLHNAPIATKHETQASAFVGQTPHPFTTQG
jgi:hypothetical protein